MSNGQGDVSVSLGGDLSPFMSQMARAKELARAGGEAAGLEFGNRTAYMAEQRVKRGMDGVLRSLATAKDPIEAITGAVEGLSSAFRIAGSGLLALGIGTFLYEEFTKASESAKKLSEDIEAISKVDPHNESMEQLRRDIEGFQKVADQYANRGLLEKILFGPEEDEDFTKAASLNELKKNLLDITEIENKIIENKARILEASDNPEDHKKAKGLRKSIADKQESGEVAQQLSDAQDAGDTLLDQLQEQQRKIDELNERKRKAALAPKIGSNPFDPNTVNQVTEDFDAEEKALREGYDGIVKAMEANGASVAKLREEQATQAKAQAAEAAAANKPPKDRGADEAGKKEAEDYAAALKKRQELQDAAAEEAMTGAQKEAALRDKIAKAKSEAVKDAPLQTETQKIEAQNAILEDQARLWKLVEENKRAAAEQDERKSAKAAEEKARLQALQARKTELLDEQTRAKAEVIRAEVASTGFHGPVSSLRREALAGRRRTRKMVRRSRNCRPAEQSWIR